MGNYLSIETLDEFQKAKKHKLEPGKICTCGDYAPFTKGGSCRHCYGFLK